MDSAKDVVLRILKEGNDVLPKLVALIEKGSVPDPKGIIKNAALYALEQKHEFRAVCHYVKEWQKWNWAKDFLIRMENRVSAPSSGPYENCELLLQKLLQLVSCYEQKQQENDPSQMNTKQNELTQILNEPKLSRPIGSKFRFEVVPTEK
jgi:hypothetical protein